MQVRPVILTFLIVSSAALFAYTSYRAFNLSFTHDESISYDLVMGNDDWKGTANHHPLNTKLMGWAIQLLGTREWQLRLPNVLAHALYLILGLLLLTRLKSPAAALAGFALLNLNPFILEFFSLARGYGLALGLTVMALYFLCQAWRQTRPVPITGFLFLSLTCASLADLANFSWLNLHLAVFGAAVLVLLVRRDTLALDWSRQRVALTIALAGANAWFIRNLARRIWSLQEEGQLYARGRVGFVPDTIGTLVDSYLYGQAYPQGVRPALIVLVVVSFVLALFFTVYRTLKHRNASFSTILMIAMMVAVAAPITEHHVLGVEYPVDRIALFYIPLVAVVLMFLVEETLSKASRRTVILSSACLTLFFAAAAGHLLRTTNVQQTFTWAYDADTKDAVSDILDYHSDLGTDRRIKIGNNWLFEPTLNFYRRTLAYEWLTPATRVDLAAPDNDVVFCYPEDLQNYPLPYTILKRYARTGTLLVKIEKP